MSLIRRLASRLLRAAVRHSSPESQEWVRAMLNELDFIESDWAAWFWALGSARAIFKYSFPRPLRAWLGQGSSQEERPMLKHIRRNAAGTLSGIGMAVGVLVAAFGLVRFLLVLFPASDLKGVESAELLAVIVAPETIFVVAAVALWRKRRPMAVGLVLSAVILVAHVVVHLATH
jgi:hypothetical protein